MLSACLLSQPALELNVQLLTLTVMSRLPAPASV